jgi:hypothetical protein
MSNDERAYKDIRSMGHTNVKQIHTLLYQYHFLFRYFCCLVNLNVLFVLLIFNTSGSQ